MHVAWKAANATSALMHVGIHPFSPDAAYMHTDRMV